MFFVPHKHICFPSEIGASCSEVHLGGGNQAGAQEMSLEKNKLPSGGREEGLLASLATRATRSQEDQALSISFQQITQIRSSVKQGSSTTETIPTLKPMCTPWQTPCEWNQHLINTSAFWQIETGVFQISWQTPQTGSPALDKSEPSCEDCSPFTSPTGFPGA